MKKKKSIGIRDIEMENYVLILKNRIKWYKELISEYTLKGDFRGVRYMRLGLENAKEQYNELEYDYKNLKDEYRILWIKVNENNGNKRTED